MKSHSHHILSSVLSTGVAFALIGCAVSNKDVQDRTDTAKEQTAQLREQFNTQRAIETPVVKVKGNYVGGKAVELGYNNTLPASFRDVILRYPDAASLREVAERITETTGIPVDIGADVLANSAATPSAGASTVNSRTPTVQTAVDGIRMDFRGNLGNFLDALGARYGFGWQYVNNTINFSRLVTKAFQIHASPGTAEFNTRVSKGSSTSTGSTGGAGGAQSTGSFAGTSDTSVRAAGISASDSIQKAITSMLSPQGRVVMNDATGSVIITDTRMVVDQIGKLIDHENLLLTRQVSLQVDLVTVQINDASQFGFDANLIYNSLGNEWGATVTGATAVTTSASSSLTYNVLSGTNSRYNGSSLVLKALNSYGRVVQNTSIPLVATNRQPMPIAQFATKGYLAATTPANGGATTAGTGVPGLTPGSITTGLFLSVLPTILDNNSLLLRMSMDQSTLLPFETIGTGSGATAQQIQIPNVTGYKSDHNVSLKSGDTLVLVGIVNDGVNGQTNVGLLNNSLNNQRTQTVQVLLITPRVQAGI